MRITVPVAVAAVALGAILMAAGCDPKGTPDPRPSVCPTTGCEVPAPKEGDPAFRLYNCSDTGDKGPCGTLWPGTDDLCHWWQVNTGHTLDDGTAVDLGVWTLDEGEECA
jgi:hypothetical protein